MKVVSLQDRYHFPTSFKAYEAKIEALIAHHAKSGAELILFPEYAGLEMLSFAGWESLYDYYEPYIALLKRMSAEHRIIICSGTHVVKTERGTFNRAHLFFPSGQVGYQDKCQLTPFEVEEGLVQPGETVRLFETPFGKIAICICYDVEFPQLVSQLIREGAQLILVPSYTASVQGYHRVFLSCRARALEGQCYVMQSSLVGQTDVELAFGASAILSPVDQEFPEDGILAVGKRDEMGAVAAELSWELLERVRQSGQTHNYHDTLSLNERTIHFERLNLG